VIAAHLDGHYLQAHPARLPEGAAPITSAPVRDPLSDHLITPKNAALLFIDYQPAQLAGSAPTKNKVVNLTSDATSTDSARDRRWLILGVVGLAQLMVVLDLTVMNIALPSAQRALHFTTVDRQWVVTAYTLAFGSLLLLGGRLADLLGRKVTFLTGLAGFAAVSAIGGVSVNFAMLVTARACQGAFAALLVPSALSLLTTTFTEQKDRAKAFGIYGAIAGAGGAVGLLLGGALTEYLSWRWTLYVNLLFAGVAFIGGALLLQRQPTPVKPRLDVPGVLLV
jgi:MFS family permease